MAPTSQETVDGSEIVGKRFLERLFRLQAMLVPAMGLLDTIYLWRFLRDGPTHPTLGRALLLGLIITVGVSLIAVVNRTILGSNRGMAFPFLFLIALRPVDPNGPLVYVLISLLMTLVFFGIMLGVFAPLARRWDRSRSEPAQGPQADAELEFRPI